jgi:hypothetical protein
MVIIICPAGNILQLIPTYQNSPTSLPIPGRLSIKPSTQIMKV